MRSTSLRSTQLFYLLGMSVYLGLSCGGGTGVRSGADAAARVDSSPKDEATFGPVSPPSCAAEGEKLRRDALNALDAAVDAALSETLGKGGVCIDPIPGASGGLFAEFSLGGDASARFQLAGTVVSDGEHIDLTASSFPSEVLRLEELLSENPALTRISVGKQATGLLQLDKYLLVYSQEKSGFDTVTHLDVFDGARGLPAVTRHLALPGQLVSAFRIGSASYALMRRAPFHPTADPTALIPPEINCKGASPKDIRIAFEALRKRLEAWIVQTPIDFAISIEDTPQGSGTRQTVVEDGCGDGNRTFTYLVAIRPVGTVPPSVAKVTESGFFAAPEDGIVLSSDRALSESAQETGVYLLSGASIRRVAGIDTKNLRGTSSAFWHNDKLYVFTADGGRTAAVSWRTEGDTFTAEGEGKNSAAKNNACEVHIQGWQHVEADPIRAVTFIKDRAYLAACRGLEVWTAADGPPRYVSATGDDAADVYLKALDDTRLLAAGYTLGSDGTSKQVVLRVIDVKNPLSPKVQQETVVVDAAEGPYLDPRAVRVEGNTIALPIVFAKGKTSGAVYLYRFDTRGFKPLSRVPYAAHRSDGRPEENQQIFLKAGRVIIVTDNFLQINRTDHPENMLYSLSR